MPSPTAVSNHRPVHTPPAEAPAPTSPGSAPPILELVDGVDRPERREPATCRNPTRQADALAGVARAYIDRGREGVRDYLDARSGSVAALGRMSSDALVDGVERELRARQGSGFLGLGIGNAREAGSIAAEVGELVGTELRERVRSAARARIENVAHTLETVDATALTERLRGARSGTGEHEIARHLGVDGGAGDARKVALALQDAMRQVQDFGSHVFGMTWEPSDFPSTTAAVMCAMGLRGAPRGSIVDDVADLRRATDEAGHHITLGVEIAHGVAELAHFIFHPGLATGGPLAVGVAGLAFGFLIHHEVEANQEARRAFAAEIGL